MLCDGVFRGLLRHDKKIPVVAGNTVTKPSWEHHQIASLTPVARDGIGCLRAGIYSGEQCSIKWMAVALMLAMMSVPG